MHKRLLIAFLLVLTSLPALADGSPAAAYMEYHEALKRGLGESALWPHITPEARDEFESKYPEQLRPRVFYMMKKETPDRIRLDDQRVEGNTATVVVVGTDNELLVGTVTLRRQDNRWRVEKVVWQRR